MQFIVIRFYIPKGSVSSRSASVSKCFHIPQKSIIRSTHLIWNIFTLRDKFYMARRLNSLVGGFKHLEVEEFQKIETGLRRLEDTVIFEDQPCIHGTCYCLMCNENVQLRRGDKGNTQNSQVHEEDKWLLRILNGLVISHCPCLALHIPDICFVEGNTLQVFHTDPKDNKLKKLGGVHPQRTLFPVMVKLRRQYKWMLGENYKKNLKQNLDPSFMHQKYLEDLIPSYLSKADMMARREAPQQNIVVHKNQKLVDENIEEHKLQENESFCTAKFKNGASQIFTKAQFERWMDMRNKGLLKTGELSLVQSFIKQKQEVEAFFVSVFTLSQGGVGISDDFDQRLYEQAENEILVLLGGISKYSKQYDDMENFQDFTTKMMKEDPKGYIKLMTYKIVHYLGMVSRIYVKHIKINWILNDIGQIYLQSIMEFETVELAIKALKYRLPPKQRDSLFYKDPQGFQQIYNQIHLKNQQKRRRFRQEFSHQATIFVETPLIEPKRKYLKKDRVGLTLDLKIPLTARRPNPSIQVRNTQQKRVNSFSIKRRHNSEMKRFQL